jgi:tetratricopeptide (TPR) repeat protein
MNPANPNSTPPVATPRPIFLSGTVTVDDGSPLPSNVRIQSVCGVQQHVVAHTASSGSFSFVWGSNTGIFEDASESGRSFGSSSNTGLGGTGGNATSASRGTDPLDNCELRADYPGYTSSSASLYQHSSIGNSDVGTIVLHRLTGDEGHVVSVLALKAPKDAKRNFDKGTEQARANKPADAAASFQKAVAAYPQYADAWFSLGRAESRLGAKDAAEADFHKAMELDGKMVGPWQELGYIASDQSKWEDAARYLDKAVRLDPTDSPMAWYFSAVANYNLGRFDVAERSVRAEMKLDKNPDAEYLLGLVLIGKKDLKGGAEALRNYIAVSPKAATVAMAQKQLIRVESQLAQ